MRSASLVRAQTNPNPTASTAAGQIRWSGNQTPTLRSRSSEPTVMRPTATACSMPWVAPWPVPPTLAEAVLRQRDPEDEVEQDAGAAGEGQHDERQPHDDRIDAEAVADPGGHATDDAVVASPDQAVECTGAPATGARESWSP